MACTLSIKNLSHAYSSAKVLDSITLEIESGKTYGVIGPNGAGKSTFLKIVAGLLRPTAGSVSICGEPLPLGNPRGVRAKGVSYISQEQSLIDSWTVADQIRYEAELEFEDPKIQGLLKRFGLDAKGHETIGALSAERRQVLEIVKALARLSTCLLVDEPTSGLDSEQRDALFESLQQFASSGGVVLVVSHDLSRLAKSVQSIISINNGKATILSDPSAILTGPPRTTERNEAKDRAFNLDHALTIRSPSTGNLEIRCGEIVGVTGSLKTGVQNLLRQAFGLTPSKGLTLTASSDTWPPKVKLSQSAGIAYISRERQEEWGYPTLAIWKTLTSRKTARLPLYAAVNEADDISIARELMKRNEIRPESPTLSFDSFSGGNRQKAVVASALSTPLNFLFLDEPISGVDGSARLSLAANLRQFVDGGAGALVYSQEVEDLERICDRVVVVS